MNNPEYEKHKIGILCFMLHAILFMLLYLLLCTLVVSVCIEIEKCAKIDQKRVRCKEENIIIFLFLCTISNNLMLKWFDDERKRKIN